jgi:hypothetical protein
MHMRSDERALSTAGFCSYRDKEMYNWELQRDQISVRIWFDRSDPSGFRGNLYKKSVECPSRWKSEYNTRRVCKM